MSSSAVPGSDLQSGHPPVWDVHAHYLPEQALELMGSGRAAMAVVPGCGVDDNVTLNGMSVGTPLAKLTSVDSMLAAMDTTGVSRRVLSPPPFTYRYWSEPQEGLRLCRLLNDALAEVVAAHPDRFSAVGTVPLQAPDLAVAELARIVDDLGLSGVSLGTNVDGRHLSDELIRPLLTAAADRGAPVLVHPDFTPNERWKDFYLINLVGLPTESALSLAGLLLSGRLAELPHLRICFVHGGGSLPYLLGRVDWGWQVRPECRTGIDEPPAKYLGNVYFDALTHDPQGLRFLIDMVGADHVAVGTDAPFDVEEPDPVGQLLACPRLTDRERDQVLHETAARWLLGAEADGSVFA
ncbi:amidohydrolase family protein [Micromonospora sp. NPDC005113]